MRITVRVAAPLPDNLVARGERNQVSESFQRQNVAIANRLLNGFF